MKYSKAETVQKTHHLPTLKFEDQQLTSFSGLLLFQQLFNVIDLREKLRRCFRHQAVGSIFGSGRIVLLLIVHFILGFRHLREMRFHADDPIVQRTIGLKRPPDVATVSRALAGTDGQSVNKLQKLLTDLVLDRLLNLRLTTVTLDFDGSVLSTGRFAEGTAVGFNRKKKGQRSYYPLFCTVAQTGQVLDVLHRSGNVHDSNGAEAFIRCCVGHIRRALPRARIEARLDSAFFSDQVVSLLDQLGVDYSISVPFTRLPALKEIVENRQLWYHGGADMQYFELQWKPKSWRQRHRFVVICNEVKIQSKEPVQLDLFEPFKTGCDFKVVISNKSLSVPRLIDFHNGRGSQEGIFGELKSENALAYVPTRTWTGNQTYMLAALLAHNLTRELQMRTQAPCRKTNSKRANLWKFMNINTVRRQLVQRAGRLIRPQGRLVLSMSANAAVKNDMLHILGALKDAA